MLCVLTFLFQKKNKERIELKEINNNKEWTQLYLSASTSKFIEASFSTKFISLASTTDRFDEIFESHSASIFS